MKLVEVFFREKCLILPPSLSFLRQGYGRTSYGRQAMPDARYSMSLRGLQKLQARFRWTNRVSAGFMRLQKTPNTMEPDEYP
jgi:hypothetical protein